jgi:hypothetical protein
MHNLWVSLPLLAFAFTLRAFQLRGTTWRDAFIRAAILLGVALVAGTELLSALHAITFGGIVALWTAIAAMAASFLVWRPVRAVTAEPADRSRLPLDVWTIIVALGIFAAAIAVIGLIAPPNTGDTLEYHMPKVLQWVQNHSVAFFPTAVPRQIDLGPGAEYGILHLQLLSGSDRFANMVEWFAFLGSIIAVSLIAQRLGATVRGQALAAVFAATTPMGIMQASSTQTDFVAAFWIVCFIAAALRSLEEPTARGGPCLAAGAALGLAVFTKATSYVFAAPFALGFGALLLWRHRTRALLPLAGFTAMFLALNLTHYVRVASIYGSPLGPGEEPAPNTKYAMELHSLPALTSSLAKNVGSHLMTPWPDFNRRAQQIYLGLHRRLGLDLNDPRTSWGAGPIHRFNVRAFTYHDEVDGNPLHFLLAVACGALVLALPPLWRERTALLYTFAVIAAGLLFVGYLKWHPWMSRLHLPWFVMFAPLIGVVIGRWLRGRFATALALMLLAAGIPWVLYCQERPLFGQETIFNTSRDRQYLMNARTRRSEAPFLAGKAFLEASHATRIGLIVGNSSFEFWWWALPGRDNPALRFQHVNVTDPAGKLSAEPPFRDFVPDALLALDQRPVQEMRVGSKVYVRGWSGGRAAIYLPKPIS